MSDIGTTNQLPPRSTTSTRWPRKWSTLGGRGTSSSTTIIPTNDSYINENSSKTNGHRYQSTSLFRKASTISRTNGTPIPSDENTNQSLKKSRSLMNVLRSKLNSPAVLRRFRSKSRESTKQTVTEINGHSTNEQQEVKQPNNEQTSTTTARKSRKRDPSPMRRLANRISHLTRHQRPTSNERQKESPSKSPTNDPHKETTKSPTPIHNKDEVEHINACYDEIRAKYFNNDNTNKRTASNNDTHNHSLLSNDYLNDSHRINPPDDPLLQARKQANLKLNCLLNGYNVTTSFAHHERSYGQNDLFKFHHYYDVGKRKYDWNFTNANNSTYSSMRARPISKSIDSFRPTIVYENQASNTLQKINIVDNNPLDQAENHEDVPKQLPDDNELVIHEDSDLIQSEQTTSQYSSNIHVTPPPVDIDTLASTLPDENNTISNVQTDEEFEQDFLRAVDRALGVVNKDEEHSTQPIYDIPTETDEPDMNLIQMTERVLSSFNNLPIFTNDDENNDEPVENGTELIEPLSNEQPPIVIDENREERNNHDVIDEDISSVIDDLIRQIEELLFKESKNGQTFLVKLDDEEKTIKSKSDAYNNLIHSNDNRLTEDVCTDINAVIGEVNLLLRGKLKQFRGLCEANVTKLTSGAPIPLDSDLEGFWDITYPLLNKVNEKFAKLDARKAKQWAPIEEYDPDDINNRPRVIDDRLKQLQPQQNKSSKIPTTKSANGDLKKLIQERRKAAANAANQNHDIEIFVAPK